MKTLEDKKKTYLQPLLRLVMTASDCLMASGQDVETTWGDGNNWDGLYPKRK